MLKALLAAAENLKADEQTIKETAELSTEAKDTQTKVKGADFNNALVGIHPQLRHMPPRLSFSTIATFLPN